MTIPSKRPPAARVTIACPDRFTVATVFFLFFLRFEPQIDYLCPSKSNAMDQTDLQPLYDNYHRKIAKIDLRFKRYLYRQINWKTRIISIRGPRGVGKTFWTQALQDKNIRRMLSQDIPEFENTRVAVGYGNANTPELYPSTNTFSTLLKEYAPSDIWRTIIVHAVASHPDMSNFALPFAHGEWADDVKAVQSSPEKIDDFLHNANKKLEKSHICLLILFDALDRVAETWKDIDVLTTALLRMALQFSTYSSLKIKIFLREDHYNRLSFSFPDSSKLLSYKIDLTWNRAELYSLLWKQLCNAPNEYGETLRALFTSKTHEILEEEDGVWQFKSDAQLNDEKLWPLVHELTGPYMGKDQRRGIPYIWIVGHLADARLQTTPRSFLVAIRRACEEPLFRVPRPSASMARGRKVRAQGRWPVRTQSALPEAFISRASAQVHRSRERRLLRNRSQGGCRQPPCCRGCCCFWARFRYTPARIHPGGRVSSP